MKALRIFVCMVLIATGGCIEEIDVATERNAGQLIITGRVTNNPGPHYVYISQTSALNRVAEAVGGAEVILHDDDGNRYFFLEELPGKHSLATSAFNSIPGKSYFLEVIMPNGKRYLSQVEKMPTQLAQDQLEGEFKSLTRINSFGIEISNPYYEVYLDSEIPEAESPQFYQWVIEEVFEIIPTDFPDPFGNVPDPCYLAQPADVQRINIFSSLEERSGLIENRLISQRLVDYAFLSRYFINAYQYSITPPAYDYLSKIRSNINQSGSIFDIPPATIVGNMYNPDDPDEVVYGYFSAALERVSRKLVRVSDLPYQIVNPCAFDPFKRRNGYPTFCLRCFDDRKSIPKPDYF